MPRGISGSALSVASSKYNAHEYQQYFCTDDSLSLPDNQIQDLMLDSKKAAVIATVNGPCLYTDQDVSGGCPCFRTTAMSCSSSKTAQAASS